ncbi:hypothetical protein HB364_32755 [Pseudoflavitalea sp. X16]|uniref:hypothetical protein n=1 Tax=Paraflavitalea devenefica TaxID=2716334 RepID=UPI001420AD3C|nr:hypothetical protein [Paraflavitalea devenefica]NII29895.1 hypothetical protein [Paraflavitalea devenefica]
MRKMILAIGALAVTGILQAQEGNDTSTMVTVTVINPCTALTAEHFVRGLTDQTFADFCLKVFRNNKYEAADKRETALRLLKSVKAMKDEWVCFVPFLKLIDATAEKKSEALCGFHPYVTPPYYDGYCQLKKAPFAVLYYIEFVLNRQASVNTGMLITELDIQEKGKSVDAYEKIVELYIDWYEKSTGRKAQGNPLKGSGFKWEFKTIQHNLRL